MKLSLAFAKEDSGKNNLEIKSLKELRNYLKECSIDDYKFNFVKQKNKISQKSETDRIYLIPFIFEYQLSQLNGSEEDSLIIKMTSNLYGLLLDNINKSFIPTKDIFLKLSRFVSFLLPGKLSQARSKLRGVLFTLQRNSDDGLSRLREYRKFVDMSDLW